MQEGYVCALHNRALSSSSTGKKKTESAVHSEEKENEEIM